MDFRFLVISYNIQSWLPFLKTRSHFVIYTLLFLFLGINAQAKDFYVSPIGKDSSAGTITSPWKTVAKANKDLMPGDTVFLRSGTYDEQISPANSGTSGKPIVYKAYPGEKPVIDRSRRLENWQSLKGPIFWTKFPSTAVGIWEDTFEVSGHHCGSWPQKSLAEVNGPGKYFMNRNDFRVYVWLSKGDDPNAHVMMTSLGHGASFNSKSHIVIDGIGMRWVQRGLKLKDISHCVFQNLDISYAAAYGFYAAGSSNYNRISQNQIFHCGSWFWDEGDGIYLSGHHNLIERNGVSVVGHNPIATRGDLSPSFRNVIQYNKVHNSGSSGLCANVGTRREVWRNNISSCNTGAGYQNDSSYNIMYGNQLYGNGMAISLYSTEGKTTVGNRVFNNTMFENNRSGAARPFDIYISDFKSGVCKDNVFKNNIVFNSIKDHLIRVNTRLMQNNIFVENVFYRNAVGIIGIATQKKLTLKGLQILYPSNFKKNHRFDPELVRFDKKNDRLVPRSQCVDSGGFLTKTIDTGVGTAVTVEDAGFFFDGFGIVAGDQIQFEGSKEPIQVIKIDYEKNALHLIKPVSWEEGIGVSLPYLGVSPDIGASESISEDVTPNG